MPFIRRLLALVLCAALLMLLCLPMPTAMQNPDTEKTDG